MENEKENSGATKGYVPPFANGFYATYYEDKEVKTAFVQVPCYSHIEIILDKGLFIVKAGEDTKFVCHIRDLIAWRY